MKRGSLNPRPAGNANGELDFGQELWKLAHSSHLRENQVLSPLVSDMIMNLVGIGARDQTEEELRSRIKLPAEIKMAKKLMELLASVQQMQGVNVYLVCGLYAPTTAKFKPSILRMMESQYRGEAKAISYDKPVTVVENINAFIARHTNMQIARPVARGDISSSSQLTLVNCLYFKGIWKQNFAFHISQTVVRPFMTSDGTYVDVAFMTNSFQCLYAISEEYDCRAVGLPYEGDHYTFVVVLPNDPKGLPQLEKQMDSSCFQDFRHMLVPWPHNVNVSIPKFIIRSKMDLIPILKAMGVKSMFGGAADFGGFFDGNKGDYRFTTLIQKVVFEINEDGGRSHHAFMSLQGRARHSEDFIADHPFLFFVYEDRTDSVLLCGSVNQFEPLSLKHRTKSGNHMGMGKSRVARSVKNFFSRLMK